MRILKYESFLETMQFVALSNAQRLAKQEEERRKAKREEEDSKNKTTTQTKDSTNIHYSDDEMEEPEGQGEMEEIEEPEGQGEIEEPQ